MGCNYYLRLDVCKCCDRPADTYHIGKSSVGWPFLFNPRLSSYEEWKTWINCEDNEIEDEYHNIVNKDAFFTLVEAKKNQPTHYTVEEDMNRNEFRDELGYRFSRYDEFS